MMTRKAFSFALPMVLLAAACSDNSDTPPDPDATMTVEPDGGIGDGAGPPEPVTADTVPAAFLGVWDAGGGDCAAASSALRSGRARRSGSVSAGSASRAALDHCRGMCDGRSFSVSCR